MEVASFHCVAQDHCGEANTGEIVLIFEWQRDHCSGMLLLEGKQGQNKDTKAGAPSGSLNLSFRITN